MKLWKRVFAVMLVLSMGCMIQTAGAEREDIMEINNWHFGFGRRQIIPNEESDQPLYIAGYNSGWEISGVLDYCEARAVWMDTGSEGILLIGIDCVALASGTVAKIREGLSDIPNCASVNVYSTHTHAGPDTLGLWGPLGVNGKNDDYMDTLIEAAVQAGREAAASVQAGRLHFGQVKTMNMYRDSREPQVYDPNLYQLRFEAADGEKGVRMLFYGAHAESLRGANRLLSRDFAGRLCDQVSEATGDNTIFMPGAIGGLIMTKAFVEDTTADAVRNLTITSDKLTEYALSITPEMEREIEPEMTLSRKVFTIPMDNPAFLTFKMLGILDNQAIRADGATGYGVQTELSVLMLGDLAVVLIPGEMFPELVSGEKYGDANPDGVNPRPLREIAKEHGIEEMLIIGLANDEVGYIVPPSDFLLNEKTPYIERIVDYKGEDHYEETNSVGPRCAECIAEAFEDALDGLK